MQKCIVPNPRVGGVTSHGSFDLLCIDQPQGVKVYAYSAPFRTGEPFFGRGMAPIEDHGTKDSERDSWFQTTHWTQVQQAGESDSAKAQSALTILCQTYWYPLYVFVRRQGQSPEDAQDLVQGFFMRLLQKHFLKDANPEKGRFRSFLLIGLKRFMANEWDRANRLKRGGGIEFISLDEADTEQRYQSEPADELSPEKAYQRQWAVTLLERVLQRLQSEFSAAGKQPLFEELKSHLSGESDKSSYSEIAGRLGMTEAAVKVAVYRLRQRYRELLRLEIANTVTTPEAIDDEIRELFAAVG